MATRHLEFHRDVEWAAQSEPLPTRNMPVQVFYGNTATTSCYVRRLRATYGTTNNFHEKDLQEPGPAPLFDHGYAR
jgi:hypothetical protein